MEFLLLAGIATAFNILIILWKFTKHRYLDAIIDLGTLVIIAVLFAGTVSGLQIGMIASFIVSVYLLINPPKLPSFDFTLP